MIDIGNVKTLTRIKDQHLWDLPEELQDTLIRSFSRIERLKSCNLDVYYLRCKLIDIFYPYIDADTKISDMAIAEAWIFSSVDDDLRYYRHFTDMEVCTNDCGFIFYINTSHGKLQDISKIDVRRYPESQLVKRYEAWLEANGLGNKVQHRK